MLPLRRYYAIIDATRYDVDYRCFYLMPAMIFISIFAPMLIRYFIFFHYAMLHYAVAAH